METYNFNLIQKLKLFKFHVITFIFLISIPMVIKAQTPVEANGELSVSGTNLINKNEVAIQLRGMSSHGPGWFQSCYNETSLDVLVNDWGIDIFRIAMYTEPMYIDNPDTWKTWIDNMVEMCEERGIYCLIDWHILSDGDPNTYIDEAIDFFDYMSAQHADKENILYEICNEPNGVNWNTIKTYANQVIPVIRANDPNSIIIVGTPDWCQKIDVAASDLLEYDNLMYAFHFYAGSHSWLKSRLTSAVQDGLPIFVTEFGTSESTGDGGPYLTETQSWLDLLAANKISWCNWSFAAGDYTSDALEPGSCDNGNYNNTKEGGTFIKNAILYPEDNWDGSVSPINKNTHIIQPLFYPNPAKNILFINGLTATSKIEIFNINSNKILVNKCIDNESVINIEKIPSGIYIIKFIDKFNVSAQKLLIE